MGCCSWRLLGALAVAGAILAGVLRVKLAARTNEFLADESLLDDPTMQAIDGYVQNIFTTQEVRIGSRHAVLLAGRSLRGRACLSR